MPPMQRRDFLTRSAFLAAVGRSGRPIAAAAPAAPPIRVASPPSDTFTTAAEPSSWLQPVPGASPTYDTVGQPKTIRLEPLYRIFDERYAVYWKVETT